MTPLPKRRWSTRRQGKKRAVKGLGKPSLVSCPNCKQPKRLHQVCPSCGQYKGKTVLSKVKKGKTKA